MFVTRDITEIQNFMHQNPVGVLLIKSRSCAVCEPVSAKLEVLLQDFPQVSAIAVYAEEVREIAGCFLVFTVPTILVWVEGKEVYRESRFIRFEDLRSVLDRAASR